MPRMRKRAYLVCLLAVLGIACFAARVYAVNANAPAYGREVHAVGERVDLDGSFAEYAYENTDGYAIQVDAARLMSRDEYLDAYAQDASGLEDNPLDTTDADAKTLVVLDITIRNDRSADAEDGYLDSLGWSVVPDDRKELWLRVNSELFDTSVPQIEGAFQLSVRPGTSFTIHVPFSTTEWDGFPAKTGSTHLVELQSGSYQFTVTNVPVRHIVKVDV